jgi:lipopolysaccharide heptosyltransferase II
VLKFILQITGWLLAHTPQIVLRGLSRVLGHAIFFLLPRRRRLFFANLDHAFPERPRTWQAMIARESSCRLIETALLSLASPFFSDQRLRAMATMTPETEKFFIDHHAQPYPLIVASPHIAYWESLTSLGLYMQVALPEFGVIFRPLDNPTADAWVKSTRERHGLRLLSRKDGLAESFRILRRRAVVGVLFDQNAGMQGALTTLFGRVCSTSELPGLLAERSGARIMAFYPRRLGFWKLCFEAQEVFHDGSAASATLALNRWLETTLSSDDNLCASWLWSHDRWRHQDMPEKRFRLESKRDLLSADLAARQQTVLPRKTRVFVRLPNWLGDVVMTLPLLRALRASRPDAEITLIAKSSFGPLLKNWDVADRFEPLPARGIGYFVHFWKLRRRYPDVYLLFTNSTRGDIEAWLTRCRQRFGLVGFGRQRKLLTHCYAVPREFDERQHHQLELWENFLRHFGLNAPLDRTPGANNHPASEHTNPPFPVPGRIKIGFIAGSENNPEKRWPLAHWRRLAETLLAEDQAIALNLFGTATDQPITSAIADGLDPARTHDLAGRTDLAAYVEKLRTCELLIANDTGGMHLANALGVPVVALFGPTNPVRTGAVFSAPFEILQPPGCPATGGASLADLSPETVLAAVHRHLAPII